MWGRGTTSLLSIILAPILLLVVVIGGQCENILIACGQIRHWIDL